MFKLLSINQLLAQDFYHTAEKCSYTFKKAIGKYLIFTELDPEIPYCKRLLRLSIEQLFSSREVEILNKSGNTISVYNYFEDQYINIKNKLKEIKTAGELRELLAHIAPFLFPDDVLSNINNIRSSKKEILNLLEEDWQQFTKLRKGKSPETDLEAESVELCPLNELDQLGFSLIELQTNLHKSQLAFANLLENTFFRNEIKIARELKHSMLPFLEILTADYINSRMFVLASDIEISPLKAQCQIEAINDINSIPPDINEIFSGTKAAIAKLNQDGGSFMLVLIGIHSKIDGQHILVKSKISLPTKHQLRLGNLVKRLHLQKNLGRFFSSSELYSEIYYGLSKFLSHRSHILSSPVDMASEIKDKIDTLLQSPNIYQDYGKLLATLDKQYVPHVLTILMDKKKDKIKGIILITIQYYLKEIKNTENFYAILNLLKKIKSYADSSNITFTEKELKAVVADIESLMKSADIDNQLLFLVIELLFKGSIFLATYQKLSEIRAGGISSEDEYTSLCLRIFDHNNWVGQDDGRYTALNPDTRSALIDFMLQQAQLRLNEPDNIAGLKRISDILNQLNPDLTEADLRPLVANIRDRVIGEGCLIGSAEEISNCFEGLEIFFAGSPHLAAYKQFSQICMVGERFSDYVYVTIGLSLFDDENWVRNEAESLELKAGMNEIIKKFVMQQAIYLLPDAQNRQKTGQNRRILAELGILLAAEDVEPLIEAIETSPIKDNKNQEIKNGQGMRNYFDILADFLSGTKMLNYYNKFAEVKLGRYNFSDFYYVTLALKILDHRNWRHDFLNEEMQQEVKQLYFKTFLNTKLSQDDKVSNLNILHNQLKIAITEEEKNELGEYVKNRIGGLVDLLDAMEKLVVAATN